MINNKVKILSIIGIILVLEITLVNAQFPWQFNEDIIPFLTNSDALVQRLWEIAEKYKEHYLEFFYKLARRVEFIHYFSHKVDNLMNLFQKNLIPFLLSDPPLENLMIITLVSFFISLLQPLYILAIIITAIYLLFISGSPRGRVKAKGTFIKLILGIGLIMLTIPIMQLLLEISHSFSSLVLGVFDPDPKIFTSAIGFFMSYFTIITFFKPAIGSLFLMLSILLPTGVLIILSLRYFLVILLTIFFPFTIFFYSFSPTQRFGKALLFQTFLWIFLPVMEALILGVIGIGILTFGVSIGASTFPILEMKIFLATAGFLLLIFSPLLMFSTMNFFIGVGIHSLIKERVTRKISEYL